MNTASSLKKFARASKRRSQMIGCVMGIHGKCRVHSTPLKYLFMVMSSGLTMESSDGRVRKRCWRFHMTRRFLGIATAPSTQCDSGRHARPTVLICRISITGIIFRRWLTEIWPKISRVCCTPTTTCLKARNCGWNRYITRQFVATFFDRLSGVQLSCRLDQNLMSAVCLQCILSFQYIYHSIFLIFRESDVGIKKIMQRKILSIRFIIQIEHDVTLNAKIKIFLKK